MDEDYGFDIPSKKELDSQPKGNKTALVADDYIVRLTKIELTFKQNYANKALIEPTFKMLCIPYSTKDGQPLMGLDKTEVAPLSKWIFRDISFSLGFSNDKPSFLRALIAYMEGVDVDDPLKVKKPVLLDPKGYECKDEEILKKAIEDLKGEGDGETIKKGYKVVPDIRIYEGRYIGATVTADKEKNRNKLISFSKLPVRFEPPTKNMEADLMSDFEERYQKMIDNSNGKGTTGMNNNSPVRQEKVVNESLEMDVPEF